MFSRKMVEAIPCPRASYKDSMKKKKRKRQTYKEGKKDGERCLRRYGCHKKSWAGICWCHSVNQWEFNYQPGVEEP